MKLKLVFLAFALLLAVPAQAQEKIAHGRFGEVTLYRPHGAPTSVVLFLSGDGGWNLGVVSMAQNLVRQGSLVVGISTPAFIKAMEKDGASCEYADGDLENLSHFIQAYAKLPVYLSPIIVGYSSGATLSYAMLAQSPDGTFAGALALGFCPELEMHKPLCKADGVEFTPSKDKKGVDLLPVKRIRVPFIAMQGEIDQVCMAAATQEFVAQIPHAEVVMLPKVGHGYSVERNWLPQFNAAFARIVEQAKPTTPPVPKDISDLPVVEVPAQGDSASDMLAVLMTGDGGWAGLDKEVAAALAAKGIPVVGLDSLRYYWTPRTPAGAATDVDRLIRFYSAQWKKKRVLLLGYSQGADVLPFVYNRLPKESRERIALAVPMGIGDKAAFEFHLTNWVGGSGDEPTMPEMEKFAGNPALFCIFGDSEKASLCAQLDPQRFRVQKLPGGHHFNGNYDKLAQVILDAVPPP